MNLKKEKEAISLTYDSLCERAIKVVEEMARDILRKHKNLHEFIMGMGIASFNSTTKDVNGWSISVDIDEYAYMNQLYEFICQWDEPLGITGTPMRFTADGPVITEW